MRIGDVYPRRKIELGGCFAEKLIEPGEPVVDSLIYKGLHFLDIAECIWTCCDLAEVRMHFVFPHVEQAFSLPKGASDVVVTFVGLPIVYIRQICSIANQQQCGRYPQNRSIFLMQGELQFALIGLDVVISDP